MHIRQSITLLLLITAISGCAFELQQEAARRQAYVQTHSALSPTIKNRILQGKVSMGMTSDEVMASWGNPNRRNRSVGSWGVHEQWVYGSYGLHHNFIPGNYLYFENGQLTSWQD